MKSLVFGLFRGGADHLERGAAVWIHGHTHEAFDYVAGTTRVVCNPHGYPGERRGRYPTCVVDSGGS